MLSINICAKHSHTFLNPEHDKVTSKLFGVGCFFPCQVLKIKMASWHSEVKIYIEGRIHSLEDGDLIEGTRMRDE